MVFEGSSAAISHTGRVRSNNQDSGYAGSNLFVVADGMGGHAGRRHRLGHRHQPAEAPRPALRRPRPGGRGAARDDRLHGPGSRRRRREQTSQLAGLGTTVSGIVMVDEYAVIAHIGDSRIYLYRDGELTQITTDHTFVQRLVETGRIAPRRRGSTRADRF